MPEANDLPYNPPAVEPTAEELLKREEVLKKLDEFESRLAKRIQEKMDKQVATGQPSTSGEDLFGGNLGSEEECCGGGCGCPTEELKPEQREDTVVMSSPFCWDELKPHSLLLIKLDGSNPMRFAQLQHALVTSLLEPRMPMLKEKKISVVFMGSEDDISTLDETEMNRLGWFKKEKTLIIPASSVVK